MLAYIINVIEVRVRVWCSCHHHDIACVSLGVSNLSIFRFCPCFLRRQIIKISELRLCVLWGPLPSSYDASTHPQTDTLDVYRRLQVPVYAHAHRYRNPWKLDDTSILWKVAFLAAIWNARASICRILTVEYVLSYPRVAPAP